MRLRQPNTFRCASVALLFAIAVPQWGCDNSAPSSGPTGGVSQPAGPTSVLGKSRQAARDLSKNVSEGGPTKEGQLQHATMKMESAQSKIDGWNQHADQTPAAESAIKIATDRLSAVKTSYAALEGALGPAEKDAKTALKAAIALLDEAMQKAESLAH